MLSILNGQRPAPPPVFRAQRRFVAFLDVLGMTEWVKAVGPTEPAVQLESLTQTARGLASGQDIDDDGKPVAIPPLVGTILLSDSLFAYSVDDSWTSFWFMSAFLAHLVGVALKAGVPLRGALARGETVIDRSRGIITGTPLAAAYESDKEHEHRGVGVHLTTEMVAELAEMARRTAPPTHVRGLQLGLFVGAEDSAEDLIWYNGSLFINHWRSWSLYVRGEEADFQKKLDRLDAAFGMRGLKEDERVREKREQTRAFMLAAMRREASRFQPAAYVGHLGPGYFEGIRADIRYLAGLGLQDGPVEPPSRG